MQALPVNVKDIISGHTVEWERLEFKSGWNPLSTLHTICAFANDFRNLGGGYIVIGISEHKGQPVLPPVGLSTSEIDGIQKEILNLGFNAIQPYYHPIAVPTVYDGKTILILWVIGGQTRPYKAKLSLGKQDKDYGYFIRKGSSTVRAKGADEAELISLAATVPFDDRFNQQAKIEDLSRDLMLEYIKRNLISETVIKHSGKAESTRVENFPYDAIEEAIVNAVYHRCYDVREPIEIRITHDELVVLSYPGPDRSVNLEQLRKGKARPRRYRNRRIGEFLKELEFTEGRATGIPKIIHAMNENGSPPAEFEFDDDHSYFMVRLPVHPAAKEVSGPTAEQVEAQVGTKSGPSRDQVLIIPNLLHEKKISELLVIVGRSNRTKFRDQVLRPLIDSELVEMTIPDKPNSRLQKYRLTEKGKQLLSIQSEVNTGERKLK